MLFSSPDERDNGGQVDCMIGTFLLFMAAALKAWYPAPVAVRRLFRR